MSESDDSQNTRPISVAELLARNGTIGAPPSGGRRHRRRRNADAVSVSELTAEIPIIRDEPVPAPVVEESVTDESVAEELVAEEPEVVEDEIVQEIDEADEVVDEVDEAAEADVADELGEVVDEVDEAAEADVADELGEVVDVVDEAPEADVADVADELGGDVGEIDDEVDEADEDVDVADGADVADVDAEPVVDEVDEPEPESESEQPDGSPPLSEEPVPSRESGPVRAEYPRPRTPSGAEEMAPDPVDESIDLDELLAAQGEDPEELRTYLQASSGALFSGDTMADDIVRRGPVTEVITESVPESLPVADRGGRFGGIRHALAAVFQSVLAVLFGAGLFLGFDQLWRWNTIVALVLSVLVILGLVIAVRVVRKTEDIASTLIAVAVGALVTLGPLALLQST